MFQEISRTSWGTDIEFIRRRSQKGCMNMERLSCMFHLCIVIFIGSTWLTWLEDQRTTRDSWSISITTILIRNISHFCSRSIPSFWRTTYQSQWIPSFRNSFIKNQRKISGLNSSCTTRSGLSIEEWHRHQFSPRTTSIRMTDLSASCNHEAFPVTSLIEDSCTRVSDWRESKGTWGSIIAFSEEPRDTKPQNWINNSCIFDILWRFIHKKFGGYSNTGLICG